MSESTKSANRRDVYQEITDKIVTAIQIGAPEFEMPWHRSDALGRPVNAYTEFAYRGVNVVALWTATEFGHFNSRYWATYKQWQMLGARIKEGERGSIIIFFKETTREAYDEKEGEMVPEAYFVARSSFVFNANQVNGWETPQLPAKSQVEVMEEAEGFTAGTKANIRRGGDRAYYRPSEDFVQIPERGRFVGTKTSNATECYYATLLHELTHWTGHKSRLDRDLANRFGDQAYAMEELVAELGAAFLCGDLRITNSPRLDHAAYIANWLEVLKTDKKALFTAASKAAAAADYLTWLQPTDPAPTPSMYTGPLPLRTSVADEGFRGEEESHGK